MERTAASTHAALDPGGGGARRRARLGILTGLAVLVAAGCAGSDEGRGPGADAGGPDEVAADTLTVEAGGDGVVDEAGGDSVAGEAGDDSVVVVFTRDEEPVRVRRAVPAGAAGLRTALEWLVRGPTAEERESGIGSWFSAETAHVLRSARVGEAGRAVVDFHDLRPLIPGASSSAGSAMLLAQLNGTVFQFGDVRSVEYRMNGSCDLFWEWLQYGCRVLPNGGEAQWRD